MSELKTFKIVVRTFNVETKEIELTATLRTARITRERAIELAKQECAKSKLPACWEIA